MTRARRRRPQRGYTLIEVMASLAVLASGLMGIIALQGSTAMANQRAQIVMSDEEVAHEQAKLSIGAASTAGGSFGIGRGGFDLKAALFWSLVGVPLALGIWQTLVKALVFFD